MSPPLEFRTVKNTTLIDLKSKLENLLNHKGKQRVIMIDYHSSTVDVDEKIRFIKFELETEEDVRAIWSTFHRYKTNGLSRWMRYLEDQ